MWTNDIDFDKWTKHAGWLPSKIFDSDNWTRMIELIHIEDLHVHDADDDGDNDNHDAGDICNGDQIN